ncbi:MAG: D-2-hydroxyacid dehydrogenase [Advenella sp.]|uniref:D-2-hydroxyacid dehydrogenase n=1 Tax=Advenella sp. TaxID=1872388 RepID=UPI003F9CF44A
MARLLQVLEVSSPTPSFSHQPSIISCNGDVFGMQRRVGIRAVCHSLTGAFQKKEDIDIAFFSRDVYEGSSLRKPGALSDEFFSIVDNAPHLRWLHVCSSGLDLPQYVFSLKRDIRVTSAKGATAVPIAQTVVAAILALSRGFGHWLSAQNQRQWAPRTGVDRPRDISDQRVLVMGVGAIGSQIAYMLKSIGFHVTGVRRRPEPLEPFDNVIIFEKLDEMLPSCDWLVLAIPLTASTVHIINKKRLGLLRPDAFLANVARGELVDELALVTALKTGKLRGAYLDTFLEEPLPATSPLWELPNVWITPHNSAASHGHEKRVIQSFLELYGAWLSNVCVLAQT